MLPDGQKGTVSNLLNGRTENPSLKVILELCNAIGCDFIIDIQPKADLDNKKIGYVINE